MDTDSLSPWLTLCRAPGIGSATIHRLLAHFPDLDSALSAPSAALRRAGLSDPQRAALKAVDSAAIARDLAWLAQPDCHLITSSDPRFPSRLADIANPPAMLFVQGDPDLLSLPQVAVVGARSPSPQGVANAEAFAAELARAGFVITSGLALGIDGAAHRGALAAGYTLAVCGTGLDRVYPARHRDLAHRMLAQGSTLVSEYPLGVGALAENFPRRNRIISGLALGVLVVEAARESGSLITARYALEQGREVFAIPGSIHNPMARGCHALIRQGGKLVETVNDLFEELGPVLGMQRASLKQTPELEPETAHSDPVLAVIDDTPVTLDQLVSRLDWPAERLLVALTTLELEGRVAQLPGGRYQRVHR